MKKKFMILCAMVLSLSNIIPTQVKAGVRDYWNPDETITSAKTDDAAATGSFLSSTEYNYYFEYMGSDCETDNVGFDENGKEMFVIENKKNYFGDLKGIQELDLYTENYKTVISDWSGSANEEARDIGVEVYDRDNHLVHDEKYFDWSCDNNANLLNLNAPLSQFSVTYSDEKGVADNGNIYQYDKNGNLVMYKSADDNTEYKYRYNSQGDPVETSYVDSDKSRHKITYANVYDSENRLILQQKLKDGRVTETEKYTYETANTTNLTGYWIEDAGADASDRSLLIFSANGYMVTCHLDQKSGIPLADSLGTYTFDPGTSHLTYSGTENYRVDKISAEGDCDIQDGEMVYIDGKTYKKLKY